MYRDAYVCMYVSVMPYKRC